MSHGSTPVREDELHAYVDGRLQEDRRQVVAAWLAAHPEDAARLESYRKQNAQLHSMFDAVLDEPVPSRLQPTARRQQRRPALPWAAAAAVTWLTVGGAGGWLLHGYRIAQSDLPALATLPQRAAIAHVVYTPEVLHPVEVGAEQETHLTNWLSKRLGTEVRVPHLRTVGYDLVGGRLLPDQDRPAAQFMYQDAGGRRLTLYVRTQQAHGADATAFRYSLQENVAVFYWIDESVGYALSGEVDKAVLLRAAELVYRDLNP